jgi:hypothetical protein
MVFPGSSSRQFAEFDAKFLTSNGANETQLPPGAALADDDPDDADESGSQKRAAEKRHEKG